MAGRAVWEKATKWRAGIIGWDSVVEKVWRDTGGNQEERMTVYKFGRYKTEPKERRERRERLALRRKVKSEKHSRNIRGIKTTDRNENIFARINGLSENAETAISCR